MFSSVSSWLGATKPDDSESEETKKSEVTHEKSDKDMKEDTKENTKEEAEKDVTEPSPDGDKGSQPAEQEGSQFEDAKTSELPIDLNEVSAKAVNTAKEWGCEYLFPKVCGLTFANHLIEYENVEMRYCHMFWMDAASIQKCQKLWTRVRFLVYESR